MKRSSYKTSQGHPRIAVTFKDHALFDKITKRARANMRSISEEIVDLSKCGVLDLEDSERHEIKQGGVR